TYTKDVVVEGCYAGPATDGSGLGPFGALMGSHTSNGEGYYEGIRVVDSRCEGSTLYGIQAEAWRNGVITGNEITDTTGTAIYVHHGVGGVISGNTVRGPGSNGVNVTRQGGVRVADNTIDTPTGDSGSYCVYLNHVTDGRIEDNLLRGGPTAGLKFAIGTTDTVVRANTFRRDGGSPHAVIADAGEGTTNTVVDNDFTDYGDGPEVIDVRSGTVRTSLAEDS
ncbi:MAG: right-handed parallel beta-helix repeat-containing protein, partial [Micromonosporaceae bacterium]